jgi:hypothetical protein
MLLNKRKGKPCKEQYEGFAKNKKVNNAVLLPFLGVENYDIYNPSVPFEMDGITWMAGRIEPRGGHDSYVGFLTKGKMDIIAAMICRNLRWKILLLPLQWQLNVYPMVQHEVIPDLVIRV